MSKNLLSNTKTMLFAGCLAASIFVSAAFAQATPPQANSTVSIPASRAASSSTAAAPVAPHRYQPSRFPKRARKFYGMVWGVDSLSVKSVEAGQLIRFSYRVVDAESAKVLNDKKVEPYLIGYRARVKLVVPSVDNVGMLRQASPPQAGRSYWMAFSNKGAVVKPGDRVSVVIGSFRADGLVVE